MNTEKQKNFPLVSVITINYNQSGVTIEFLNSMQHCTYPNLEIWVVDNASPTDNPEIIKEKFPAINFIKSKKILVLPVEIILPFVKQKGNICFLLTMIQK